MGKQSTGTGPGVRRPFIPTVWGWGRLLTERGGAPKAREHGDTTLVTRVSPRLCAAI